MIDGRTLVRLAQIRKRQRPLSVCHAIPPCVRPGSGAVDDGGSLSVVNGWVFACVSGGFHAGADRCGTLGKDLAGLSVEQSRT